MERKLSRTTAKLRSLKELLSSTISLNQNSGTITFGPSSENVVARNRAKNSVSLFNLMDPQTNSTGLSDSPSTRPMSMSVAPLDSYGFTSNDSKSVSMYGLVEASERNAVCQQNSLQNSKNPAVRLFYSIRSKFRKRRRDRSKIADSKSTDFGTFLSERNRTPSSSTEAAAASCRYQLKLKSQSSDNIDSFATPLGYRHESEGHRLSVAAVPEQVEVQPEVLLAQGGRESRRTTVAEAPQTKCLTKELCDLLHYGWYWGGLSKEEAEEKLKGQPDGAFVVRDSSSDHYLLSLSFNSNGRTLHTRIEYRNGEFRFYSSEADSFPTVAELIEHCIAYSEAGVFCYSKARRSDHPSYPVRLTKPVSRFTEVKSLLYLSRFVIRKHVRVDLIPQLPLPPTLIDFIGEQRYI